LQVTLLPYQIGSNTIAIIQIGPSFKSGLFMVC